MQTTLCDICNMPMSGRQHKIIIKKAEFSFYERWFNKLDVCGKCADRIIYNLKQEIENE